MRELKLSLLAVTFSFILILFPVSSAHGADGITPWHELQGIGREGPDTDIYNNPKVVGQYYMSGRYWGSGSQVRCIKGFLKMWEPRVHLSVKERKAFAGNYCILLIANNGK